MPAEPKQSVDTRALTMVAFAATAGAFIEYHDFFILGYAAGTRFRRYSFPGCRLPGTHPVVPQS